MAKRTHPQLGSLEYEQWQWPRQSDEAPTANFHQGQGDRNAPVTGRIYECKCFSRTRSKNLTQSGGVHIRSYGSQNRRPQGREI